jgi:hypothetical protein
MKYPGGRSLHTSNAKQPKSRDRLALRKCRVTRIPLKPNDITTPPPPLKKKLKMFHRLNNKLSCFLFLSNNKCVK